MEKRTNENIAIAKQLVKLDDGRYACGICNKEYKAKGFCKNHIAKEHVTEITKTAKAIEKELNEQSIAQAIELFFDMFRRAKSDFQSVLDNFIDEMKNSSVGYASKWKLEKLIKQEVRRNMIEEVSEIITHHITDNRNVEMWKKTQDEINIWQEKQKEELLRSPFNSASTSAITNCVEMFQYNAKAEFISSNYSMQSISMINNGIKHIVKTLSN